MQRFKVKYVTFADEIKVVDVTAPGKDVAVESLVAKDIIWIIDVAQNPREKVKPKNRI
jgi:hypothetical protein